MVRYLTVKEAAEVAGVSPRTIRRYAVSGEVIARGVKGKRGQEYRIHEGSLRKLLHEQGRWSGESDELSLGGGASVNMVPKALYDEIRDENKRLLVEITELTTQIVHLQNELLRQNKHRAGPDAAATPSECAALRRELEAADRALREERATVDRLRQEIAERDALISLLEQQLAAPTREP